MARALVALGYEHVPEVGGRGEFARRGGILDVFPAGQPWPVRAEWFGDEVDSLRAFDPADQRGSGPVDAAALLPASEFLLGPGTREALETRLGRQAKRLSETLAADLARFDDGSLGDAAELWGGDLAPATALDHLGDAIWIVDEPVEVAEAAAFLVEQAEQRRLELEQAGELPTGWAAAYPEPRAWKQALLAARTLELTWEPDAEGAPPGGNPFGWHEPALPPAPLGSLGGDRAPLARARAPGSSLASDQSARLEEILAETTSWPRRSASLAEPLAAGGLALVQRSLNGGFGGGPDGLVLVTDRELFGTVRVRRPRAMRRVVPRDLLERLEPGDVVVHVDHGVARYDGLVRRPAGGRGDEERDFLELHFAGADRIWVPVEQIDRVSRYAGADQAPLSPSRRRGVGSVPGRRVRKAVTDLARDLLALYAARSAVRGRAFGEDTPWQAELEAAFPYEETPDQLRAVDEVKADMERDRPMDRLVGGDVGYGKTEVALRAAFKAVQDGKQVAVLVPTTVLAVAAPRHLPPALRGLSRHGAHRSAASCPGPSSRRRWPGSRRAAWTSSSAPTACSARTSASATSACSSSTRSSASA